MLYTDIIKEVLWFFFIYSFLGWVLETAVFNVKNRKLANRGLVNGPLCIIYGFGGAIIALLLRDLTGIALFIFAAVISTVVEWIGAHFVEFRYHERWWDYSNVKFNLDGYVCLPASLIWGVLGFVCVTWLDPLLRNLFDRIPDILHFILLLAMVVMLLIDLFATMYILSGRKKYYQEMKQADQWFTGVNRRLGRFLASFVERRIRKAYPKARVNVSDDKSSDVLNERAVEKKVFAYGCCFDKIIFLFIFGSVLGDVVETLYCRISMGYWMSRSSLVWGPFSIVWGLAIAFFTLLLYKYKDSSDRFLFLVGFVLGGTYEYVCSVFTEIAFGKVFWDYSGMPFNLGGRINLLFCFFWGIAAVIWFKHIYPRVSSLIEKLPRIAGKIIVNTLLMFMIVNIIVSSLALIRYNERDNGINPTYIWQNVMDDHFPDSRMEIIYPKATEIE